MYRHGSLLWATLILHNALDGFIWHFCSLLFAFTTQAALAALARADYNEPPKHMQTWASVCATDKRKVSTDCCASTAEAANFQMAQHKQWRGRTKDEKKGNGSTMKASNGSGKKTKQKVADVGDRRKIKNWWILQKHFLHVAAHTVQHDTITHII